MPFPVRGSPKYDFGMHIQPLCGLFYSCPLLCQPRSVWTHLSHSHATDGRVPSADRPQQTPVVHRIWEVRVCCAHVHPMSSILLEISRSSNLLPVHSLRAPSLPLLVCDRL
ncbi:hypothetical protein BLNAU_565 [Blattamonas nauphoetae]|uniref:Uncharacterized protein n=1 Tax=Blattamonas nauphoetae TaxID=2049346 RepID=A0ABQ9YLK9_9EUKA|nr:hypothetical protein BLNAU_565 [Blattamonas nauphoetae]